VPCLRSFDDDDDDDDDDEDRPLAKPVKPKAGNIKGKSAIKKGPAAAKAAAEAAAAAAQAEKDEDDKGIKMIQGILGTTVSSAMETVLEKAAAVNQAAVQPVQSEREQSNERSKTMPGMLNVLSRLHGLYKAALKGDKVEADKVEADDDFDQYLVYELEEGTTFDDWEDGDIYNMLAKIGQKLSPTLRKKIKCYKQNKTSFNKPAAE
jgi:hypothetical protein